MEKKALVQAIVQKLFEEREILVRAAHAAHSEATDEQSRADSKYDTRGLEASYLARGQSRQAVEIDAAIREFGKLPVDVIQDRVDVGALVEVGVGRERTWYFLGPRAGGTEVVLNGHDILVLTPQSPLGSQLMGKQKGESAQWMVEGMKRTLKILNVS